VSASTSRPSRLARESSLGVDLGAPGRALSAQIGLVVEAARLEERGLDPPDEILDGPLLVAATRPADLDAHAELEHPVGEGLVPLRDRAVLRPRDHHRLRPIADCEQRHAACHFSRP